MKKKLLSIACVLLFSSVIAAQPVSLKATTEVSAKSDGEFYFPKFSVDGSSIYFTGANFTGIYRYDRSSKKISEVNAERGAGYNFEFSPDGNTLYYRTDRYINRRKYSSLKATDLRSMKTQTIQSDKRQLSPPVVLEDGSLAYIINKKLSINRSGVKQRSVQTSSKPFAQIENGSIALYSAAGKTILTPLGCGNYIWPSVSPDGTKLLFTLAGRGTYVTDLNGKNPVALGKADYPQWSPDGKWIAYMLDEDDGIKVTLSDIYVQASDGSKTIKLTDGEDNEMYPSWSPEGDELAVSTDDGRILLLQLNIEK